MHQTLQLGQQFTSRCSLPVDIYGTLLMWTSQWFSLRLMSLIILQGTVAIFDEPSHLKDVLARIVVEIIKREWPQQWEQLLPSLNMICAMGVGVIHVHRDYFMEIVHVRFLLMKSE